MLKVSLPDEAICNFLKHAALRVLKGLSEGLDDDRVTSGTPGTRPPSPNQLR